MKFSRRASPTRYSVGVVSWNLIKQQKNIIYACGKRLIKANSILYANRGCNCQAKYNRIKAVDEREMIRVVNNKERNKSPLDD